MPDLDGERVASASTTLTFFVNGKRVDVTNPEPEQTLLEFLRRSLLLTGTKLGCGEGGCGACTVMVSRCDQLTQGIHHYPVNACLAPVCSMHGLAVTTVEGIGSLRSKLHPVQRQLADNHGSQCGFCTPGIVMSVYSLLRNNPKPTQQQMEHALDGNLCRCTGYRPILEGFKPFTQSPCGLGAACCKNQITAQNGDSASENGGHANGQTDGHNANNNTCDHGPSLTYDPTQDVIFPPELKLNSAKLHQQNLEFTSSGATWLRPASLRELLDIRKRYPDCKLVCGNTEIGIEMKMKRIVYPVLVSVSSLAELTQVRHTKDGLQVGACVTLEKIDLELKKSITEMPEFKTRVFSAFVEMLRWFAGHQIRSVACLAGNIMTASPISDLNPLLLACKAVLDVVNVDGVRRQVMMDEKFFTGYRQTCLNKTDTLISVTIPYTHQNEYFFSFKQANRKEDDIAIVNAGMRVDLGEAGSHISDITLAYGGMAVTTVLATKTMAALKGRKWDSSVLDVVTSSHILSADLPLPPGAPGGMVAFRRTLTYSFFFRFFLSVSEKLGLNCETVGEEDWSGVGDLTRDVSTGSQVYQMPSDLQSPRDAVGRPIIHQSAYQQATGEAIYVDDIPVSSGELFAGYVLSTKAHAKIVKIDTQAALQLPGVVDFVSVKDVPGDNMFQEGGDLVFAEDEVIHDGQVIGVVLADNLNTAQRAANLVEVTYEEREAIFTIQDAIAKDSFFKDSSRVIKNGDVNQGFSLSDHVLEGEIHIEAQEHFYLEPQTCIMYPKDWDEYQMVCSSQGLDYTQLFVSRVLGVSMNQVNVCVKRIGGGFGGKETRQGVIALPTAVAAYKLRRPVRTTLERHEDMRITGTRNPVLAKYKVGFNKSGKLMALDVVLYFNAGVSLDKSGAIAERALLHLCTAYSIPNLHAQSKVCYTNISTTTSFRGFGSPQAMTVVETIIDHVAHFLDLPEHQVRELNFHVEGARLAFGQTLLRSNLMTCWTQCMEQSRYMEKLQQVEEFNRTHTWKKQGLALTPLVYGVGFGLLCKNKATAVVSVYSDGSVIVMTGGTEMGQGLHTKIIQVTSRALDVPVEYIRIGEPSSHTSANSSPTAASFTSDLCGMAVVNACNQLNKQLAPYRDVDNKKEWRDIVSDAIVDRECVTAVGHYKPEMKGMDWNRSENQPYLYYSFGSACTQVEIDCLTGDHQVLRTDIVMDVGHSLNPAIDVGQIEGGFLQGYGLLVLEQYKVSRQGRLLSQGPGAYKIPTAGNIPQEFNVTLLKDKANPVAVYSSKAIGEPPLCLATSVLFAIKSAIRAARKASGLTGHFRLDTPATPDKIRMACMDKFARQFAKDAREDEAKSWFVKQ